MSKQKINYSDAINELEKILSDLENNQEINMDLIASKVKRSTELIQFCKEQLHELDVEVEKMIEKLED